MKGIDAGTSLTAIVSDLKDAGVEFAGRYYSYNAAKNLSPSEALALCQAGIKIVSVFEARGDQPSSFTAVLGQRDASQALICAQACGQPEGTAIYFAVDFDAGPAQMAGITAYFQAVKTGLAGKFKLGAYGSGYVLNSIRDLLDYLWLAQSQGWRGTQGLAGAHIIQGPETIIGEISVDSDTAPSDCGAWLLDNVAPVSRATEQDLHVTITALQTQLASRGYYKGKIDGIAGPMTNAALIAWESDG